MTSRAYAEVVGDPIAQSKSPLIHNFWIAKLGIDAEYRASRVAAGALRSFVERRAADPGWRGCNVTMPLKLEAMTLAGRASREAIAVGASNMLAPQGQVLVAGNSDVAGILAALPYNLLGPGSRVCIIGTGGAARAALVAVGQRRVASTLILARDRSAGSALLDAFKLRGSTRQIDEPPAFDKIDVVINATPLGMNGKAAMSANVLKAVGLASLGGAVLDMVYDPVDTELLSVARAAEWRAVDGLEMLVAQAASAFEQFFGYAAPREHDAELRALLVA